MKYPDWGGPPPLRLSAEKVREKIKNAHTRQEKLDLICQLTMGIPPRDKGQYQTTDATKLLTWFEDYVRNARPVHQLVEGDGKRLFCAHACANGDLFEERTRTYEHFTAKLDTPLREEDRAKQMESYYTKESGAAGLYEEVPHRFFADIGGPPALAKKAWQQGMTDTTPSQVPSSDSGPDGSGPVVHPPMAYEKCAISKEDIPNNILRGAVGHQPVGYFPYFHNHLLCTDVSGSNSFSKDNTRNSLPMIHLKYKSETDWTVNVTVKIRKNENHEFLGENAQKHMKLWDLEDFTKGKVLENNQLSVGYTIDSTDAMNFAAIMEAAGDGVNRVVGRVKNDEEEKEGSEEEHVKPGKFLVMKQESDFPFKYRYSIVAWPATAEA